MNRLQRARLPWLLFVGCLLTLLTVGCATGTEIKSPTSTPTPIPSPDKVDVTRFTTPSSTKLPPLEIIVTDPTRVQRLYQAMQALPKFPIDKVIHCPVDTGVKYHLNFSQGHTILLQAILDASGCRALHLTTSDIRQTSNDFFSLLATVLGVPISSLS